MITFLLHNMQHNKQLKRHKLNFLLQLLHPVIHLLQSKNLIMMILVIILLLGKYIHINYISTTTTTTATSSISTTTTTTKTSTSTTTTTTSCRISSCSTTNVVTIDNLYFHHCIIYSPTAARLADMSKVLHECILDILDDRGMIEIVMMMLVMMIWWFYKWLSRWSWCW